MGPTGLGRSHGPLKDESSPDQMHSPRWVRRSPVGWKQAAASLLTLWLRARVEVVQQQQRRKQSPFMVISCSGAEWQLTSTMPRQ